MNPFHDLGRRRGGDLPTVGGSNPRFSNSALAADRLAGPNNEPRVISLKLFASLLALGVLGLAGLLSLGVGGVALVQGYAPGLR